MFYLKRLFSGIRFSLRNKLPENSYIYSTSNFVTDALPSFILKLRGKNVKWIGGYYLEPPNPFYGYDEAKKKFKFQGFNDLAFYLQNKISRILVNKFADYVYVTSEPDKKQFINEKRPAEKIVIIKGGVDLKIPNQVENQEKPEFDAVFLGRFHPQKGPSELVDMWREVCKRKPDAKLAMIGNGPLEQEVKDKVKKYGLEKNVILFGFMDGLEKIKIFKNSKIVLHPASYDSGGMAACEAMACKLPGISYDLEALKTYYPKGMLKTEIGNQKKFIDNIFLLLSDKKLYEELRKKAYELAQEWDWDKRAEEIYNDTFRD